MKKSHVVFLKSQLFMSVIAAIVIGVIALVSHYQEYVPTVFIVVVIAFIWYCGTMGYIEHHRMMGKK